MKLETVFVLIELLLIVVLYLSLYVVVFVGRIKNRVTKLKKRTLPLETSKEFAVKQKLNQL